MGDTEDPYRVYTNISGYSILKLLKALDWTLPYCVICDGSYPVHNPGCDLVFHIKKLEETNLYKPETVQPYRGDMKDE